MDIALINGENIDMGLFLALTIYHRFMLPYPDSDVKREGLTPSKLLEDFFKTFVSFFQKKHIGLMFFFLLTYRLGESQLAKIASPFLLDSIEKGGLALSTTTVGMIYGTIEYPENKCTKSQGLLLVLHWLLIHFVVFVHIIVLSL